MTDDLKERLLARLDPRSWDPLCAEAAARITDLEARLAAAEAGEDALAEAIRITRERLMDAVHSEFDGVWSAEDFNEQEAEAVSALAAYEARREK